MKKHKIVIHEMVYHAVRFGQMILLFWVKWHRFLPPPPPPPLLTAAAASITNKFQYNCFMLTVGHELETPLLYTASPLATTAHTSTELSKPHGSLACQST